jgi:predicted adenylyl cyclase CyaB
MVDKRDYSQLQCDYIRIRDEGDVVRLSAKTHAREGGNLTDQKEIDVIVSDFEKTKNIIESMGFIFSKYQETKRELWHYRDAEITIDTWPCLEPFSEIEAKSEEDVYTIANLLGLSWENKRITAVTEILAHIYGLTIDETLKRLEYITFEKNSFEGLERKAQW